MMIVFTDLLHLRASRIWDFAKLLTEPQMNLDINT